VLFTLFIHLIRVLYVRECILYESLFIFTGNVLVSDALRQQLMRSDLPLVSVLLMSLLSMSPSDKAKIFSSSTPTEVSGSWVPGTMPMK